MGLFKHLKLTPDKMMELYGGQLINKDGNIHVLIMRENAEGIHNMTTYINCMLDGMREHDYQIINVMSNLVMNGGILFVQITYK